jgi:hypothetical protein
MPAKTERVLPETSRASRSPLQWSTDATVHARHRDPIVASSGKDPPEAGGSGIRKLRFRIPATNQLKNQQMV